MAGEEDTGDDDVSAVGWLGRATQPGKLDLSTDRGDAFKVWKERWEDYFLLSGIKSMDPRVQMAALRACLSDDTLRVVRNMDIEDFKKNDISTVIKQLETYAIGQVNEVLERKRFNSREQAEGETFDDFLTSLRDLSRSCNFCRSCNESLIRDRIVMGLRCADTVQKLCAVPNLSLAAAISLCRAQEAASRDVGELRGSDASAYQISAVNAGGEEPLPGASCRVCSQGAGGRSQTSRRRRVGEANTSPPSECRTCGRRRAHRREADCPALRAECHRCGRIGHFAAVCRAPQVLERRLRNRRTSPGRDRPSTSAIIATASTGGAPRVKIRAWASRASLVSALPDTGADITVGGEDFMDQVGGSIETLSPPTQHPQAADGKVIKSLGILPVRLSLGNVMLDEDVHILPGVRGLLLSWLISKRLRLIPADYPCQISTMQSFSTLAEDAGLPPRVGVWGSGA